MFTTPKTTVSSLPSHTLVSSQPFINLSARHTGPVVPPAEQDSLFKKGGESKSKQKAHKPSKSDKARQDLGPQDTASSGPAVDIPGTGDDVQEPVFQPVQSAATADRTFQSTRSELYTGQDKKSTGESARFTEAPKRTGQESQSTGHFEPAPYPPASSPGVLFPGPGYGVSKTEYRDLPQQELYDEFSGEEDSIVEEGKVFSDVIDRQDQTEDMTYRETVRSVRSFMGWSHIPVYESDLSEPDKSNDPWKGKNPKKPARISVAMPPDD